MFFSTKNTKPGTPGTPISAKIFRGSFKGVVFRNDQATANDGINGEPGKILYIGRLKFYETSGKDYIYYEFIGIVDENFRRQEGVTIRDDNTFIYMGSYKKHPYYEKESEDVGHQGVSYSVDNTSIKRGKFLNSQTELEDGTIWKKNNNKYEMEIIKPEVNTGGRRITIRKHNEKKVLTRRRR
jgi:hypothetical protein